MAYFQLLHNLMATLMANIIGMKQETDNLGMALKHKGSPRALQNFTNFGP